MAILTSLLLVIGCRFSDKAEQPCYNSADCSDGEKCFSGQCLEVDCFHSEDCLFGEYCAEDYECKTGCFVDGDCHSGDGCNVNSNQCESYGCRDSQLDCRIGEFCIDATCQVSEPSPCQTCSYEEWTEGMEPDQECVLYSFAEGSSCDWRQNTGCPEHLNCYPDDGLGLVEEGICVNAFAFLRCQTQTDCPRGFFCKEDIYQNGGGVNVCWADCRFYLEQGYF